MILPALAAAVMGAMVGSFLATLCLRWPRCEQAATGRSRCDGCGTVLAVRDLVPVLSSAVARGRCRTCSARIDPFHRNVELAAAAAGAIALSIKPGPGGWTLAVLMWLLLPIAILDARHHWLPDRLTLLLAITGLTLGGMLAGVPIADRVIGAAAGFASLALIAWAYRGARGITGLGGGDPKLLAAIGLWTGWQALPAILLLASLAGLGAALAACKGRADRMPLGAFLCIAAATWAMLATTGVGFGRWS